MKLGFRTSELCGFTIRRLLSTISIIIYPVALHERASHLRPVFHPITSMCRDVLGL